MIEQGKGGRKMSEQFKKILITVGSGLSSFLGILYIPMMLLILCNLIDYITGLMAVKYRKNNIISSYRSFRGIAKKVCMWLLIVVGTIIDQLLKYAANTMGMVFPFTFLIACVVAVWLICNELISILENISDIGVNIPTFLLPLVKNIKSQTESSGKVENKESGNGNYGV